ncbi:MAG: stress-induced protein [Caulobacteraceae bacterium]|nr:stress-induced protein [Caulobacteraceae bacterium]
MSTSRRGFASMDPVKRREIASKGGRSVPKESRGFSKDPLLAAAAGRKGGVAVPAAERAFSHDRNLAVAAGRKGGAARRQKTVDAGVERGPSPAP